MRLRRPRYTIRLRLALIYGGVFLACGAVLLTLTYVLVRQTSKGPVYSVKANGKSVTVKGPHGPVGLAVFRLTAPAGKGGGLDQAAGVVTQPAFRGGPLPLPDAPPLTLATARAQARQLAALGKLQHEDELQGLLTDLGIALALMAIVSVGLGWLVAGRALRPLKTITRTARAISATNLHKRLSLGGPRDELRELGDTFDQLLERLERSFAAQRQFVANASHELRTPLTLERAIVEVALADPSASTEDLRAACRRVLAIGEQQEHTIDALLTLARSERGLEHSVVFDLKAPVSDVLASRRAALARHGLELECGLASALTRGDRRLIERLIANLLDNAIRHNRREGWVRLATRLDTQNAVLAISNSGPVVPEAEVEQLFEPFRRLGRDRRTGEEGHGLGLSIVAAIANAHGAKTSVRAPREGGLEIEVRFPLATGSAQTTPRELQPPGSGEAEPARPAHVSHPVGSGAGGG
jgi:signal transduction histidine kinase